jgi:threonylcarbamoyladenosine tRNA methylthiotransferase CDKAL1
MVNSAKKAGKFLVVAGCVPQGDRFIPEIEDISTIGVTQIDRVVEVVNETFKGNKVKLLSKKELPTLDLPKIRKNKFVEM